MGIKGYAHQLKSNTSPPPYVYVVGTAENISVQTLTAKLKGSCTNVFPLKY